MLPLMFLFLGFSACDRSDSPHMGALKNDGKVAWRHISEGLRDAAENNKKLFVYVYTDWCSWCKRMEREVFSSDTIAEYMNTNYIPVALDAESSRKVTFGGREMTEQQLASELGADGFPTHIFLNASGERITMVRGYMPADRFIHVLSFIAEDHYRYVDWEEYLEKQAG